MPKLLKEPLVHFLAGALLIFAYFWLSGASRDPSSYEIEITTSDIDRIAADAIRTSNRLPTHDEISALVDQNVREEILYREALRLGLEDGDAIIRRRLANKMRSLHNSDIGNPSEKQLEEFIAQNSDQYKDFHHYTFDQIYIGRSSTAEQQKEWLIGLRDGSISPDDIRVNLSLDSRQKLADETDITRKFGTNFTKALRKLEKAKWTGPIESGFGQHFILIHEKQAFASKVDDIRQRLTNDWRAAQIEQNEKEAFDELAKQYAIEIAPFK